MCQALPSAFRQDLSGATLLSPGPLLDRQQDIVGDVESGSHASDANASRAVAEPGVASLDGLLRYTHRHEIAVEEPGRAAEPFDGRSSESLTAAVGGCGGGQGIARRP